MKFNQEEIKKLFIPDLEDFKEYMGNYFLGLLNETNPEVLETLSTFLDENATGKNRFKVYSNDTNIANSERYYSLVNTYNIIRYGNIKTWVDDGLEG